LIEILWMVFTCQGKWIYNMAIWKMYSAFMSIATIIPLIIKINFLSTMTSVGDIKEWKDFPVILFWGAINLFCFFIFRKIHPKKWIYKIPKWILYSYLVIDYLSGSAYAIYYFGSEKVFNKKYVLQVFVISTYLLSFFLLGCLIFDSIRQKRYIIRLKNKELLIQYENYNLLMEQQKRLQGLRHDLVNHQMVITSLEKIDIPEAVRYRSRLKNQIENLRAQK